MSATRRERVGIRELRQHASKYVEMAERGITIDITRRGAVVAQLVNYPHGTKNEEEEALQELYDSGLLRPAEDPEDLLNVVPVKSSSGISATDMLLQMREEERF
jgi:antitoxin (DNA-binding transcriptional repressor) of toxin-antitoxin stability system